MRRRHPATNLSAPPGRFVGREGELAALGRLFEAHRLVTVVGPGGVGKTRLATQAGLLRCDTLARAGRGGVWFCDLSEARTLDDLCARLGGVLDVSTGARRRHQDVVEVLGEAIASRGPTFIILDNLEQVVAEVAPAIAAWSARAPEAHLLTTSRERLRVPGEAVFELGPLTLPTSGGAVEDSEAFQLFMARWEGLVTDRAPSDRDREAIAGLVAHIDGFPLAIELAAARAPMLSPAQLFERIPRHLDLLSRGWRGMGTRQSTLRGAIDWSWDLLDPQEQSVLTQCAIFRGGFDMDAAEAIIDPGEGAFVLDVLQSLCDKSLLRSVRPDAFPDERRFTFYETIRAYAAEKLAVANDHALESRFESYYLGLAERLAEMSLGPSNREAFDRFGLEEGNLAAIYERALSRAASVESASRVVRIAHAQSRYLTARHTTQRRVTFLEGARDHARAFAPSLDPAIWGRLCLDVGIACGAMGDLVRFMSEVEAVLELARTSQDRALEGAAAVNLGNGHMVAGRADQSEACFKLAMEAAREVGDRRTEGIALGSAVRLARRMNRFEQSEAYLSQARDIFKALGDVRSETITLADLANIQLVHNRVELASRNYEEVLQHTRALGDRLLESLSWTAIAKAAHQAGQCARAIEASDEALALLQSYAGPHNTANCWGHKGLVHHELGQVEQALACYAQASACYTEAAPSSQGITYGASRLFVLAEAALRGASEGAEVLEAALEKVGAELAESGEQRHVEVIPILRGMWLVLKASEQSGDPQAPGWLDEAREILVQAKLDEVGVAISQETRLFGRLLRVAIQAHAPAQDVLLMKEGARGFRPPGAEWVDLSRRKAPRLILACLMTHRLARPDTVVDAEALIAAGWPGEQIAPLAARGRLHVALHALRKVGLSQIILNRGEGWLLDPAIPAQWSQ